MNTFLSSKTLVSGAASTRPPSAYVCAPQRPNSLKEILEAAEVTHPQPGQQLTAVLLRRAYEREASVILVDSAVMASINAITSEADASGFFSQTETELKPPTSQTAGSATVANAGTNAANHYASLSESERDELLAAVVTTPQPGQLLAADQLVKPRFCKDCSHHTPYLCGPHQCSAPVLGLDLVTGEANHANCHAMRGPGSASGHGKGPCGPEALMFKPKSGPVQSVAQNFCHPVESH